jgi:4'-phosphopantetheinyl transferase
LHFSVSHSDDQLAVAVSTAPVGIDIEHIGADCSWQAISETCFHRSERELLKGMCGPAVREAFFEIWTRKEAYLKAIGTGLGTDPASFSTAAPDFAVSTNASGLRTGTWYTRAIEAPAGYRAALASHWPRPRMIHIHCRLDGALAGPASCAIEAPRRQTCIDPVAASAQGCAG